MKDAIIGLAGVIIGGIIGTMGQIILSRFDYKKWKKEKTIKQLENKKEELKKEYEKYEQELIEGIGKDVLDSGMIFSFQFLFPKNVSKAFEKMMNEKNRTPKIRTFHLWNIQSEMKKSLTKIDEKIEKEINK